MDDNLVINRIIDILESGNSNLVLGNISNPQPGSICQVTTDYGVKSAYNINCTYPGNAYVVWDKVEKCYYCFTNKPSEVINSRQLSYRKNRPLLPKKEKKGSYVLLMDINYFESAVNAEANTITFFEVVIKKMNPKCKKIYYGIPDNNKKFFGMNVFENTIDKFSTFIEYYQPLIDYLITKEIEAIPVMDTELDKVNDILWLPLLGYQWEDNIPENERRSITQAELDQSFNIDAIKKIHKTCGIVLQSEWKFWIELSQFYLDTFYNPLFSTKITETNFTPYRQNTIIASNIKPIKDQNLNWDATGLIDINLVNDKNILSYCINSLDDLTYANALFW